MAAPELKTSKNRKASGDTAFTNSTEHGHNWIVVFHKCQEWVKELVTSVRNKRRFYQRGLNLTSSLAPLSLPDY